MNVVDSPILGLHSWIWIKCTSFPAQILATSARETSACPAQEQDLRTRLQERQLTAPYQHEQWRHFQKFNSEKVPQTAKRQIPFYIFKASKQ